MDSIEQLDVVYEYLKQAKKAVGFKDSEKIEKPGDFFSLIFYPVLVKSRDEFQFPDNVIKSNRDLFSRIGGTTKKDYYNYCERIVENPQDMASKVKNFDLFGFFGEGSGANSDLFKEMIEILARFSSQTGGSVLSALDSAASKSE
jgi:hypothetical protein